MRLLLLFFLYLIVSPAGCNDKNVQPAFPPNIPEARQKDLLVQWEQGKVLFKANCAQCHGVFTKGKDSISNFTKVQIDNYASHFLARDAKNHAVMQQITRLDFIKITIFLTYLKREGNPQTPPFNPILPR